MNPVEADLKGGELWLLDAVDRGAEGAWLTAMRQMRSCQSNRPKLPEWGTLVPSCIRDRHPNGPRQHSGSVSRQANRAWSTVRLGCT